MRDDPPDYPEPLENCATCGKALDPDGILDDGYFCSRACLDVHEDAAAKDADAYVADLEETRLLVEAAKANGDL